MKKLLLLFMGLFVSSYALAQSLTIIDDLASYAGTDATVFNKADGKVYKYNSMGQYELYGVYEVVDFAAPQATEVEYITNAANSELFIPDYRPKVNTRVFATVEIASTTGGRSPVFGTREYNSGWPNAFYFETVSDNKVHAKLSNEGDFTTNGTAFVGVKSVFDLNGATGQSNVYVGGATIASQTWTRWADNYDYKYFLSFFSVNQNNTDLNWRTWQPAGMKLYGAKIYEGSTLVMDLVPVVTSDGKGGLKDRLTGSIYTNGRGTISASGTYSVAAANKGVATFEGKLVYNTADNNMYRWGGSEWVNQGTGLVEISDTKYYKFYDNTANAWNWFYPGATYDNTFAGYKTDVSATYGARANHNDAQIGAGGFEPLQYNLTCFENGANYRLSFDFTTDGFSSWNGGPIYLPLYLYAGNYGNVGGWGYTSDKINDGYTWAYVQVPFNAQSNWHIARNFTATLDKAAFIFQFGAVDDGGTGFKFWFDNIYIQKYLYPATYPAISLTSAIDALLEEADAWTQPMTTDNYWTELSAAKTNAETYRADEDLTKQKEVLDALQTALDHVNAVGDVTILRQTVKLAQDEGKVAADNEWLVNAVNFLANGTTGTAYNEALNALRNARRLAAMQRDEHNYPGQTPADGKFYLYNVGQKAYLTNGSCWGTHAALGYPGNEMTLTAKDAGYTLKSEELTKSGKYLFPVPNQDGIAKTFMDGSAANASTCVFEDAGDGSYYIKIGSEYLCFDGATTTPWGLSNRFNAVGRLAAANGDNAKWKLVTKEERLALLDGATADNPVDASLYITNPSLNREFVNGWTGLALASGQHQDGITEIWNKGTAAYDLYQTITVPKAGVYELKVQAYYRHGTPANHWAAYKAGTLPKNYAVLYAGQTGEDVYETVPVRYVHEAAGKCPGEGIDNTEEGSMPNQRYDDQPFFGNGYYWNTVRINIPTDNYQLRIGIYKDATWAWPDQSRVDADNFRLVYYGNSLTQDIEALIAEADAWTQPMTTDNYWAALQTARTNANEHKADASFAKQKEVYDALQAALDNVKTVGDITYLRPTVALAEDEGIDVTAEKAFIVSGTTSGVPVLNALRVKRQVKAKGHHDAFTGSEPTVGETYYLYNVGQGLFLCPSLVGSHELALGFAGDPLTLESNTTGGYQLKGTIRADRYIGHQWGSQGFFDGVANDAGTNWYFIPVTGTTNVYNISKADNTNNGNLLGYAPEATPTYGIGQSDGSQDWGMRVCHNRSGVDDAKNQWIFVTKAERDALLETATAANGVDATYYIVDPAIDHNHALQTAWQASEGNLDVWGDWIRYAPADANFWIANAGVSISQELTGLKPGIYSVGVQAVYMHPSDFSLSNAELFATNGAGETKTQAIAARIAGLDQVPGMGVKKSEGWLPAANRYINYPGGDGNNGAAYYFHYGQYWNEVANVVVGEDGTLTIGVKKNAAVANDAFVIDNFRLTYYGPATMTQTLTNGYATFSAVSNFKITTDGVKAYQATTQDGGQIVMAPLAGVIPANTGVVLFGEGQTSVTLTPTSDAAIDDLTGNMLRPHIERGPVASESYGCKNYLLTKDPKNAENCIFRPSSGSGNLAANRAYLAVPTGNGAKESFFISFSDDPITGIKTTMNEELRMKDSSAVYDLQGRKVADNPSSLISRPSYKKGVYIVNGKKVVIK